MGGWPQRTRGSLRSRSARVQGYYESTAIVAFGNQCEYFSIVAPTRANSKENSKGLKFQKQISINFLAIQAISSNFVFFPFFPKVYGPKFKQAVEASEAVLEKKYLHICIFKFPYSG